jgi:hypothetical protein
LGEDHLPIPIKALKNTSVKITIKLPSLDQTLEVDGTIVWSFKGDSSQGTGILVGIQFALLDDAERNALDAYCSGGDAEQNLLWNLWEDFVKG